MYSQLLSDLQNGNKRALARAISLVENDSNGYESLLENLNFNKKVPLIGITGPPGAGKSTLINAFAKHLLDQNKKVAIIAIDPSSPFNKGSLMGDRLRMGEHFLNPNIFIRSMASRGSLGGLAPKIFEVADLIRAAQFDYVIIETVGVGQSEVEIASLADTTVLVLVPEAGDEIQTIKSGVMEIADVYVLNKSDRSGADTFYKNLCALTHSHASNEWESPVVKTIAHKYEGLQNLQDAIEKHQAANNLSDKKNLLLTEKAIVLIKNQRVKDIIFENVFNDLKEISKMQNFNIYRYVKKYTT
ncbi:MAG: methylmalonyl Co-A mutase-associated GTPase MeaB [Candidatus Methylacidiphilales bacterium]